LPTPRLPHRLLTLGAFRVVQNQNVELKAKKLKKLTLSSISKKEIKELINIYGIKTYTASNLEFIFVN
jgi:hypothetical protein